MSVARQSTPDPAAAAARRASLRAPALALPARHAGKRSDPHAVPRRARGGNHRGRGGGARPAARPHGQRAVGPVVGPCRAMRTPACARWSIRCVRPDLAIPRQTCHRRASGGKSRTELEENVAGGDQRSRGTPPARSNAHGANIMTDRTATLTFSDGSPSVTFPVLAGSVGPGRHRHPHAVRQDRQVHVRPGLPVDRVLQLDDHLHRRRQGRAAVPRLPDRGARDQVRLHGGLPPAALRRAAGFREEGGVHEPRDQAHDGQRADAGLPARIPPRRASDGGDDGPRRRAVGVLPGFDQPARRAPARHLRDPADRQDADAGCDGLQVLGRPAVHVSAQRPVLCGELHADDVRHAVRGLQGQRRAGARDGPHLHPARRPRAERVDVDGAAVRVVRHQPVRGDRGGCRLPVGPGARRRQRGLPQHALRHPGAGRRGEDRRVHRQGEGQEQHA